MLRFSRSLISSLQPARLARTYAAKPTDSVMPEKPIDLFSTEGNSDTTKVFKGKKVLVVGIPGAFTPIPGFVEKADAFAKKGVDDIVVVSVNDHFVMKAFGNEVGAGDKLKMFADPHGEFTKTAGLSVDVGGVLGKRSQRYAMLVDNGKVVKSWVEEKIGDVKVSDAENVLKSL